MILANKVVKVSDSLLYKSIKYYRENKKDFHPQSYEEIEYLTILYSIGYIKYDKVAKIEDRGIRYEIRIYKVK